MVLQKKNTINFLLIFLFLSLASSCSKSQKSISSVEADADSIPEMHTEDVSGFFSSTGTLYKIEAKIWDMYSKKNREYSYFPEGFYMEKLDSLLQVELTIRADTVYYYNKEGLWKARNNVFIENAEGYTVETSELFFNEKADPESREAIYTEKFVRITEGQRVHTGYGMKSNTSLSDWRIYQASHEVEIEEGKK